MTREEYEAERFLTLYKSPEGFEEMTKTDPWAKKILEVLSRGGDAYEMIFELLKNNQAQKSIISQLVDGMPPEPIKIDV